MRADIGSTLFYRNAMPSRGKMALMDITAPTISQKQQFEANKLTKRLRRLTGQAIADFNMIEAGDKVMVCLSGGKDSYGMLDVLMKLREKSPVPFELFAFTASSVFSRLAWPR